MKPVQSGKWPCVGASDLVCGPRTASFLYHEPIVADRWWGGSSCFGGEY